MQFHDLEDLIRYHVNLPSHHNSRGFYPVLCKLCNDHGRKGNRAGFVFDGGVVGYHCFNCGIKTKFDPSVHANYSEKMISVLTAFGITKEEMDSVLLESSDNTKPKSKGKQNPLSSTLDPKEIVLPNHFYRLGSKTDDVWSNIAIEYLEVERNFNYKEYPFYLSTNKYWTGRLIIPFFKNNQIIYFQGRKMDESIKGPKYRAASVPRDCVLYGFDELFTFSEAPLYIFEGFFDAFLFNGVAILGNDFTPQQIEILNRSKRKKVYVPDRLGNGIIGGKIALEAGWGISLPKIDSAKDVDEAVKKYGKLVVLKSMVDNTIYDKEIAYIQLEAYCQ